jgi:hypothetical protein
MIPEAITDVGYEKRLACLGAPDHVPQHRRFIAVAKNLLPTLKALGCWHVSSPFYLQRDDNTSHIPNSLNTHS